MKRARAMWSGTRKQHTYEHRVYEYEPVSIEPYVALGPTYHC